jgi:hypothetical protein
MSEIVYQEGYEEGLREGQQKISQLTQELLDVRQELNNKDILIKSLEMHLSSVLEIVDELQRNYSGKHFNGFSKKDMSIIQSAMLFWLENFAP